MSYTQNGTGGYSNGYRNQDQSSRYEEEPRDGGPAEGRRVRRAGGYGGFFAADVSEQPEHGQTEQAIGSESPDPYNAPPIPNWRRAEGRSQVRDNGGSRNHIGPGSNGSRLYGDDPAGRQIEG